MNEKLQEWRCCDFCNIPNAKYIWRFHSQMLPAGFPLDLLEEFIKHPEWFACESCNKMLTTQNVTGLVANTPLPMRPFFTKLYSSLIQNLQRN